MNSFALPITMRVYIPQEELANMLLLGVTGSVCVCVGGGGGGGGGGGEGGGGGGGGRVGGEGGGGGVGGVEVDYLYQMDFE